MRLTQSLFLFVTISFLSSMLGCDSASSIEDPKNFMKKDLFGSSIEEAESQPIMLDRNEIVIKRKSDCVNLICHSLLF